MPYKDKAAHRETMIAANKKKREERRDALLQGGACNDCGNNDRRVLQWHHRDPSTKTATVATLLTGKMDRLLAEVAKCDLLCANCHLVRHAEASE